MTRKPHAKKSRAAEFISRRLHELQGRKTQADVARIAGFTNANMISLIAGDKAKLPVERAVALANALECDPRRLVRLALEQSLTRPILDQIFNRSQVSKNEQAILDEVRDASANADPELTLEQKRLLDLAFASASTSTIPAPPDLTVWALTLGLEVRAAQRELQIAKQFLTHVASRNQKVEQRLSTLRSALEEMLVEGKAATALARSHLGQ